MERLLRLLAELEEIIHEIAHELRDITRRP